MTATAVLSAAQTGTGAPKALVELKRAALAARTKEMDLIAEMFEVFDGGESTFPWGRERGRRELKSVEDLGEEDGLLGYVGR